MEINGITTNAMPGIPAAGYTVGRTQRKPSFNSSDFMETAAEKSREAKAANAVSYNEKAFASVGPNAPEEVKQAWMGAARETGVNGLGMASDGKMTHLSQLMVKRAENWMNGVAESNDILGSTVQSAIQAVSQALYDLEHPLSPNSQRSLEVQRQLVKEKAFYQSFLDRLNRKNARNTPCINTVRDTQSIQRGSLHESQL